MFKLTLSVKQNVLRFEIPVDNAVSVQVLNSQRDFCQVKTVMTTRAGLSSYITFNSVTLEQDNVQDTDLAVSSMKIPSRSSCMNSSPPHRYSRIR